MYAYVFEHISLSIRPNLCDLSESLLRISTSSVLTFFRATSIPLILMPTLKLCELCYNIP